MSDTPPTTDVEPEDTQAFEPGYGHGGVPWILLTFYLAFLVFFTWYVLNFQLPDFLDQGPGQAQVQEAPR